MAIDHEALRDACRAAVLAVWPDVTADGVWPVDRIERVPLEEIATPFAVVSFPRAVATPDWGIANNSYLRDVTFWYVFRISTSTEYPEVAEAQAELMRAYLLMTDLTEGQVIDVTEFSGSQDQDLNMMILERQKPYFAASVTAQVLVGETN